MSLYQSLDPNEILGELPKGDLKSEVTTNAGTYARENLITDYIGSVFNCFNQVTETASSFFKEVESYVTNYDSVTPPDIETNLNELDFLNGEVHISSGSLNVRTEASTSSTSIDKLKSGTNVQVVGEDNDFYKVEYENSEGEKVTGYVKKDYIAENDNDIETL